MTAYTKDHNKIGTTEYIAMACYWRDDEPQWHYADSPYKTSAAARRWVERRLASDPVADGATTTAGEGYDHGVVERYEYQADDFLDDEYGTVHDAEAVLTGRWIAADNGWEDAQ